MSAHWIQYLLFLKKHYACFLGRLTLQRAHNLGELILLIGLFLSLCPQVSSNIPPQFSIFSLYYCFKVTLSPRASLLS